MKNRLSRIGPNVVYGAVTVLQVSFARYLGGNPLAVAVGNAVPEIKETAHYTTKAIAGHGERTPYSLRFKNKFNRFTDR